MERYVLRGGRWGYDRLQMLALAREAAGKQGLAISTLEASAEAIVTAGLASADDVATALADLAAFAADPRTVIASPRTFQLWARRPAA